MNAYGFIPPHPFNIFIITYFFLGGLSAGAFLFSVFAKYIKKEFAPLSDWGFLLPLPALALGLLLLVLDLGHPERFYFIMLNYRPTSMAWWGTILLNGFGLINLLYVILKQKYKLLAYLGSLFAVGVAFYSGLLLYQMAGKPLWHSPFTVLTTFVGALLSGTAAVLLLGIMNGKIDGIKDALPGLGKIIGRVIILELILIFVEVISLIGGDVYADATVKILLWGKLSVYFLLGQVILGLILPLMICFKGANRIKEGSMLLVLVVLLLIGGFITRLVLVSAGQGITISLPGGLL